MEDNTATLRLGDFRKHQAYKYFLSSLIVGSSGIFQYIIYPYIGPAPFLLFYPSVILAALYGDGMTAIFLSAFAGHYFFVGHHFGWPNDVLRIFFFIISGLMIRKVIHQLMMEKLKAESVALLLNEEKIAREKFVSTLSHDLQTPLTSAKLQIQLLLRQQERKDTDNQRYEKIHSSINRVEGMITDLLDANRIRAGEKLHLKIDSCELTQIVQMTLADLSTQYGDRFLFQAKDKVHGYWNLEGIRRIIENLCSNAVKYGDDKSSITVYVDKAAEGALISVNNSGKPIPPEEMSDLFRPYQRTSNALDGAKRGWGLGLTLVKGIVEAHGGTVKVESSHNSGTTFTIFLPLDARVQT